jgi:iron complex outermembrane recepter protein
MCNNVDRETNMLFHTGRALLLAASILTPAATLAQTAATAEAEAGPIPDILVTARKTEESLQSAPVAVSVITANTISELGLNSIEDFARSATGISFSQAFGRSTDRPVIRGQSNVLAGVQAGVETGAAYFIDGVYFQGDIQGFDPLAIERVEIIKGPQSALYGRNTYAGAINYITKDPTDTLTITGRARAAEYSEYEVAAAVSGPIIPDVLGFRVGGRFYTYGGQYRNQLTGKRVGSEESTSLDATLLFTPGDNLRWRTRGYWQRDDDGPLAIFLQGAADNNCKPGFRSPAFRARSRALPFAPATLGASTNNNQYFCGTIRPQPNNVRLNTDPMQITIPAFAGPPPTFGTPAITGNFDGTAYDGIFNEQFGVSNIVDWDIGGSGWVVTSLTGYRDNRNLFGTDSDHSDAFAYFNTNPAIGGSIPNPLMTEPAFANSNRDRQKDFSQELKIASPVDRPFRVLVGGYFFKQEFRSTDITFASGRGGLPLGTDLSNFSTIRNWAIFGLAEWKVTDSLSITGELRYQEETKTQIDRASATSIFCAGEQGRAAEFGFAGTCQPKATFTGLDPRITVNYTTPGGTLLYGVFATGRKPGGFNGSAGITATQQTGTNFITYEPEESKGGELGAKFDALDNTLRVSLAGFFNKLTNVQLTSAIPNPSGTGAITSIVNSVGDAETKGFEIEATAAPTANLLFNLGIAYVDARFTKGCDADEFILNSGGLRPNFDTRNPTPAGLALCDISGRQLPLGSPWILNGSVNYKRELGRNLSLFVNSNFSYEDSKYVQVDNLAKTGDTLLVNARLGIRTERVTVSFFGRNLLNEDSIPLATRWFDLRYGAGTRGTPVGNVSSFDGRPAQVETGTPRGYFATLRKGRTFGVEANFAF